MLSHPSASKTETAARRGAYVVVARRYRPQTFTDLVGQQHVVRGLTSAIETNRVGHAYLFTGARGVGKTSAARILAKALNCQTGPTTAPCGSCDICDSVAGGDDVDVLEIDGASNRGIDEIRQLRQNVAIRPSRARYKIYIIDEVHMLTKDAFNALLKTLEEPPAHVKFIFATTEPNKIPLTILSRCQRFDFAGIGTTHIRERLEQIVDAEGVTADAEALEILARRAAGSMRDGQSLLEQLMAVGQQTITVEQVNTLLGIAPADRLGGLIACLVEGRAADALGQLDAALAQGFDASTLLEQLLGCFRDVMAAAVGCPAQQFLYAAPAQAGEVTRWGAELGVEKVLAIVQILQQAIARFRTTLESRTLAEVALVRICSLDQLDQLPELIAELRFGAAPPDGGGRGGGPGAGQRTTGTETVVKKNGPAGPDSTARPSAAAAMPSPGGTGPSQTTALTATTASAVWTRALEMLSARAELVADQAALAEQLVATGPDHLVAGFIAKYTACKSFCEQPQQRAKLEQALLAVTGQPVRLEIKLVGNGAADGQSPPPRTPSRRQLQAEVGRRAFVRRAMELFDTGNPRIEPPGD